MNPLEKYKSLYNSELALVDEKIRSVSSNRAALIGQLVAHIITSGGKRLRPVFVILSAKLCGNSSSNYIDMGACVELLHTATLLHDDVVDDSKLRRGRKTANNVWGNTASILVGDFLLAESFLLMSQLGSLQVIDILSRTSSIITEGEVKQLMHKTDITLSFDDYIQIIRGKTAELFAACCSVGAVVSKASAAQVKALEEFGRNLGIAFQIADDTLDYAADEKDLGKKTGDDFREGKPTLPAIHAYSVLGEDERKYMEELFSGPIKSRSAVQLKKLNKLMAQTGSIEYSYAKSREYADAARKALDIFPDSEMRQAMLDILEFCVNRSY